MKDSEPTTKSPGSARISPAATLSPWAAEHGQRAERPAGPARLCASEIRTSECDAAWQQAAGSELGPHTRAGQTCRGVLDVLVRNSAVVQELTFRKKQLLKRLAELSPGRKIRDLRFRVGAIE